VRPGGRKIGGYWGVKVRWWVWRTREGGIEWEKERVRRIGETGVAVEGEVD